MLQSVFRLGLDSERSSTLNYFDKNMDNKAVRYRETHSLSSAKPPSPLSTLISVGILKTS